MDGSGIVLNERSLSNDNLELVFSLLQRFCKPRTAYNVYRWMAVVRRGIPTSPDLVITKAGDDIRYPVALAEYKVTAFILSSLCILTDAVSARP